MLIISHKTKKEFTKKQEALPQPNKLETKEIQTKNTNKVVAFDDMKPSEIEKIAHRLFNENKYIESKIHYEYLASKKYNLAKTNFMLGEIAFNQKSYANAIKNYQESIKNDDKADYMPKLLLNAGISLEKIGDKNNADKFFKVLKSQFPNSPQAKSLK